MTNEFRVFGPPGCGKTTFLSQQVRKWASVHGAPALVVGSFTRAAAAEVAGRDLPLRDDQIGTLHSHAFRALGLTRDDVAEQHLEDFNEHYPGWALRGEPTDEAFYEDGQGAGDEAMQTVERLRAQRVPLDLWPLQARDFYRVWSGWCDELEVVDFTGMIERALDSVPTMHGDPMVGLFDEAQDFTPLELALVRKWGEQMETLLLAGDDDQCIYGFKGASPDVFLDPPLPEENVRVLSQSYRVPVAVHRFANQWVGQLQRRQAKEYFPRLDNGEPVEGNVRLLTPTSPSRVVAEIERDVAADRSVMLLATCRQFLRQTLTAMREAGLPFHNPYSRKEGQWNPLQSGGTKRRMAVDKLLSFMRPQGGAWGDAARMWTYADMASFLDVLRSKGLLARGAKTWLAGKAPNDIVDYGEVCQHVWADELSPDVDGLERGDLATFMRLMLASRKPPFDFPLKVVEKRGALLLREAPKVVVGTVHSVKGGEADVVYLMPEMSRPGHEQWANPGPRRDEVLRLFYVGMTRAREELVICEGGKAACNELVEQAHTTDATKGSK